MSTTRNDADVAFIEALAELLNRNDLAEIDVKRDYGENDSLKVRVSKHGAPAAPLPMAAAPPPALALPTPSAAEASATPPADPAQHPGAVTSPMVGTAYLCPEPGASPFVGVGAQVTEGQTLMIIE